MTFLSFFFIIKGDVVDHFRPRRLRLDTRVEHRVKKRGTKKMNKKSTVEFVKEPLQRGWSWQG